MTTTERQQDTNETQADAVVFWDCSLDGGPLSHTTITEAVERWADGTHPEPLPETVTVYGFVRMALPSVDRLAEDALDRMLEYLDEDYGDTDGVGAARTPEMQEAARRFAQVIRDEYESWACEQVTSVVVRVSDHVPAEWLATPPTPEPR